MEGEQRLTSPFGGGLRAFRGLQVSGGELFQKMFFL